MPSVENNYKLYLRNSINRHWQIPNIIKWHWLYYYLISQQALQGIQNAKKKKKKKKGRAMGGMLMEIRKELITGEEMGMGKEDEKEGLIIQEISIEKEKWKIVGVLGSEIVTSHEQDGRCKWVVCDRLKCQRPVFCVFCKI